MLPLRGDTLPTPLPFGQKLRHWAVSAGVVGRSFFLSRNLTEFFSEPGKKEGNQSILFLVRS